MFSPLESKKIAELMEIRKKRVPRHLVTMIWLTGSTGRRQGAQPPPEHSSYASYIAACSVAVLTSMSILRRSYYLSLAQLPHHPCCSILQGYRATEMGAKKWNVAS